MLNSGRHNALINGGISGKGIISVPSFDGNNTTFPISIHTSIFNSPGRYVLIKSDTLLQNYVGADVTIMGFSSLAVRKITPEGTGEVIDFAGTPYYCIVVTLA